MQKQPPEVFFIKLALQNFAKFTGKHLCQSLFLNKVASLSIKNIKNIKSIYPCLKGDPDKGVSCDFARLLNLIWVGFLGFRFEVGSSRGGRGKTYPLPCLKLVGIMLETSNLTRKYTHIFSFRKYTF